MFCFIFVLGHKILVTNYGKTVCVCVCARVCISCLKFRDSMMVITMLCQNFGHQSSSDSASHPGRMDTL